MSGEPIADSAPARRKPMTRSGADITAACDKARQALAMALDNIDTIERLARQADSLQAAVILGTFTPHYGLAKAATGMLHTTQGAIEVLTQIDRYGAE